MDQFCAKQNENYRRCVCSARLEDVINHQRVLEQTGEQLQDFKDLNIDVITKSAAEVKAMLSGTAGEETLAGAKDQSANAAALDGISDVLNKTKKKSLDTQGQLDIAGDINAIWSTTDLAAGAELANLTGEPLYNAVHAQCADLVKEICQPTSTFNMVVSAYGMYIENDCTTLANALDKQTIEASGNVRATEREMNQARLENYNTHNSSSINDCIANVRTDITGNMACGENYVHCLDITGLYLNRETGEPIYSTDFYQLETQLSLAGDVLTNEDNLSLVTELQRKKSFAEKSLDSCRDVADQVWDEFLRQAITEIYQGQHQRVRQVKDECLSVVNQCYDEQSNQLKDFSNVREQALLGARMELSEEMCKVKLDACSNLYGGGLGGMALLATTMSGITDQKIAKNCKETLEEFAKDLCAVPSNDTLHHYPYACRTYSPGEQQMSVIKGCNSILSAESYQDPNATETVDPNPYICDADRIYYQCKSGYYLAYDEGGYSKKLDDGAFFKPDNTPKKGNMCVPCPGKCNCPGGVQPWAEYNKGNGNGGECVTAGTMRPDCGTTNQYIGSVYQKLVRYALQVCIRPTYTQSGVDVLPTVVLQDVNVVMAGIQAEMSKELAAECERLGGRWVNLPYQEDTTSNTSKAATPAAGDTPNTTEPVGELFQLFYSETGASVRWGYCQDPNAGKGNM